MIDYLQKTSVKFSERDALDELVHGEVFNAMAQEEHVDNGNGKAVFTVEKITDFAVDVTNSKCRNVSFGIGESLEAILDIKDLIISDKSLKILAFCADNPIRKRICY